MECIVVNGYKIDWDRAEAKSGDLINAIEAKQLALLKTLYQADGKIVSHQELLDKVWPNRVVAPNTVQQTIAQLRKNLGDDGKSQNAIKTHPKLGYSLKFSVFDTIDSSAPRSLNSTLNLVVISSVIVLLVAAILIQLVTLGQNTPQISNFSPVTLKGEVVHAATLAAPNKEILFIAEAKNKHALYQQKLDGSVSKLIKNKLRVFGSIHLSPDGNQLAFGNTTLVKGRKCISLTLYHLKFQTMRVVDPCAKTFNHSPKWLSEGHLLYLAKDKERNNKLMLLNIATEKTRPLLQHVPHIQSYDVMDNKLLVLSKQGTEVRELTEQFAPSATEHSHTSAYINSAEKVRWLSNNKYMVISSSLAIIDTDTNHSTVFEVGLSSFQTITDIFPLGHNQYLTLLSSENWDISEKPLQSISASKIESNTQFFESNAKYKGSSQQISFISNRSNTLQVWLKHNGSTTQLTDSPQDVVDYTWLNKNETLVYISDSKLWRKSKANKAIQLSPDIEPMRLYQSTENYVLLSAKVNHEEKLIWYNLEQQSYRTLLEHKVNWAQRIADNWFITNDSSGKLLEYKEAKANHIDPFKQTTIQWRYFWRQDKTGSSALYFQDKNTNIWRYDPFHKQADIVGSFDENSLFATDISALHSHMLSDTLLGAQKDLVKLTITINE